MPTYDYGCTACGHEWEEVQRITEPPIEVCPKCSKSAAHRLISAATSFILKGGGWYADLYSSVPSRTNKGDSNGASSEAGKADKAAAPSSGSTSSTSSSTSSTAGS
jgi:putative FmdB family regulatory protein